METIDGYEYCSCGYRYDPNDSSQTKCPRCGRILKEEECVAYSEPAWAIDEDSKSF